MNVKLLSGGAAQALVGALASHFKDETGLGIEGTFGAVGAMKSRLLSGEAADLLILTRALIEELAAARHIRADSIADIGVVRTAVAVRETDSVPQVGSPRDLRAALLTADAIYSPDQKLATAGIHFGKVLAALGIADEVAGRLRTFPNGATAMRALAASADRQPIGCTQVTEILATPGLTLADVLPSEFKLATVYTAGVTQRAANADAAGRLIALLTSAETQHLRERLGFEG
jgi:molybdate transport system substrate-binding protein